MCVVFTLSIWFGEKLWSLDYNFFSDFPIFSKSAQTAATEKEYTKPILGMPKSILISSSSDRKTVLSQKSAGFSVLWQNAKESIKTFLSDESKVPVVVRESTWKSALQKDYVYIDYQAHYSTEFLSQNYSCDYRTGKYVFNSIIIKPPDPKGDQYTFLLHDTLTGKIYQFYVPSEKIHLIPADYMPYMENQNNRFSFEGNMDKPASENSVGSSTQKVFIDSMVLLNLDATTKPEIKPVNPVATDKNVLDEKMISTIASLFNVNPHTMRKFTDEDSSVTFVENYATLKIHADGYIEYKVTNENTAPALPSLSSSSYRTVYAAADFIDSVIRATDCQNELILNTDVVDDPIDGNLSMSFDYKISATPVVLNIASSSHSTVKNAIELQIKNNKLVSYKHYLRHYATTNVTTNLESTFTAIDKLLTYQSLKTPVQISDMHAIYLDNSKSAILNARWFVALSGNKNIVLN